MRNIKLVVCAVFVFVFSALAIFKASPVTGQSGGTGLAAPTGLVASDSTYNNKIGLYWEAIRGATTYRVFRNAINDPATAIDIGTTPQNVFFDTTVVGTAFYWVRAENASAQSPLSTANQGTRANTTNQGPIPPLQPPPPAPPGNPVTAAKAYLGKVLFWDEQLSSTRTVSCGTCHIANAGGVDPRSAVTPTNHTNPGIDGLLGTQDDVRGSSGVPVNNVDGTYSWIAPYGLNDQVTGRRSVTFLNAAYPPELFWDGRATGVFRDPLTNNILLNGGAALESQAAGPPLSSAEMAHGGRDWNNVAARVNEAKPLALSPTLPPALSTWIDGRSYPELFLEVFGTAEVSPARIIMAIATYERILYTDQTPFDLDAAGIQPLSAAAQRGRGIFNGPNANCAVCHAGNLFTDHTYRYIGVRPQNDDTGRFQVTGNNGDRGSFRVPSLRNVAQRGTFFHNGQFTTLNQVVAFYNRGGDFNAPNKPTNLIRNLGLNGGQQADLVAFLQSLSDPRANAQSERFDRPQLYMESSRVPQITGTGRAGSGSFTPQIKAISPPLVGNPNFTVSVSQALGNAAGVLVISEADPGVGTVIPATGSFARVTANMQSTGNGNGWASVSLPIPDNTSIVGRTFFARWYVNDSAAANGFSVSQVARFTVFGEASAPSKAKYVDFDGDGRTDVSVFRPAEGNWYIHRSGDNGLTAMNFGLSTDRISPGDYDGDGKADMAVYRDGTWFIMKSRDGFAAVAFGMAGDIPQVGDYDGDVIDDVAVFRPSDATWYVQKSSGGFSTLPFGNATDKPVAADFDGDGKTDPAVFRNGDWWIAKSTGGTQTVNFGLATDRAVTGDYDADGKADIAVWRPSTGIWFYLRSSNGTIGSANFGISTDVPTPGDYDGDGRNDLAVFRPAEGRWYLLNSTSGFRSETFGISTDRPVPSAIVP